MDLECSQLIHQDKKLNTVLSTNTLPDVCHVAGSENLLFVERELRGRPNPGSNVDSPTIAFVS
jgi:hypothetical protein